MSPGDKFITSDVWMIKVPGESRARTQILSLNWSTSRRHKAISRILPLETQKLQPITSLLFNISDRTESTACNHFLCFFFLLVVLKEKKKHFKVSTHEKSIRRFEKISWKPRNIVSSRCCVLLASRSLSFDCFLRKSFVQSNLSLIDCNYSSLATEFETEKHSNDGTSNLAR